MKNFILKEGYNTSSVFWDNLAKYNKLTEYSVELINLEVSITPKVDIYRELCEQFAKAIKEKNPSQGK